MRITVDLDEDVLQMLELELKRTGETRKAAINRLLRLGLKAILEARSAGQLQANPEA